MAPPGPPPYTMEQIVNLRSLEDKKRAQAELTSYIVRMKRENEQHPIHNTYSGKGYAHHHPYRRPYDMPKFKNRSVVFSKPDTAIEGSVANDAPLSHVVGGETYTKQSSQQQTKSNFLCPALTSTGIFGETIKSPLSFPRSISDTRVGVCSRHACPFLHDADKQALCKRWLYKDQCSKGDFCSLSHEPSSNNAPTCLHFQNGRCTNDECRFAHIRLRPAAQNCEVFGRLGFCEKGDSCTQLHAFECPTFANTGTCLYGDKCRLGHVHRASRMRKAPRLSSTAPASPPESPEEDLDTAEDTELWIPASKHGSSTQAHQFTQQADFVPLEADD